MASGSGRRKVRTGMRENEEVKQKSGGQEKKDGEETYAVVALQDGGTGRGRFAEKDAIGSVTWDGAVGSDVVRLLRRIGHGT